MYLVVFVSSVFRGSGSGGSTGHKVGGLSPGMPNILVR